MRKQLPLPRLPPGLVVIVAELAGAIEQSVFDRCGNSCGSFGTCGRGYNGKARQLLFNLSVLRKSTLASRVLAGEVRPAELVLLGANALAGERLRDERKASAARNFRKAQFDKYASWCTSDCLYRCGLCGSRHTRYKIFRRTGDRFDRFVTVIHCAADGCFQSWSDMYGMNGPNGT